MSSSEAFLPSVAVEGLPGPPPGYTLFDVNAVTLATFFGSPVAGTSLMALNYRRLGQARRAMIALLVGMLRSECCCWVSRISLPLAMIASMLTV
jgi:hypothetical protein